MTNEATFEKMKQMKLHGMLHAFRTTTETGGHRDFTSDELVAHLVDAEYEDRYNRKLARLLKVANGGPGARQKPHQPACNMRLDNQG
jgi:hypothetical protein